ncbi:MAG: glycosyltransferase family 2 protein [Desulfuromonadales bacterium]|nr:glycosyltransferase family 2 protein [Desulfuromonadales bacterium]
MKKPTIDILLSTYNGERYLREQLESILAQSFTDWRLLIRDDGSADATVSMVADYARRYPERICLAESAGGNLGACQSFARLLELAEAPYVMFSDQDDVWLVDKVTASYRRLQQLEAEHGSDTPCLVFSDVTVVDQQLQPLAPSLWRYQGTSPAVATRLNRLLLMNPANGCTMLFNRALLAAAAPIPGEALMHDFWLALVAAVVGRSSYLEEPTLLYRQHGRNESVTRRWGVVSILRQLRHLPEVRAALGSTRGQAVVLYRRFGSTMPAADRRRLLAYLGLPGRGFFGRRFDICRHRLFYCGAARNLGWLLLC